ncbi:molybdopterin-dependent oxidoreductase [Dyadobacter sandarakinus]|uniref:Molybdopterin-dependent oxidoreductase n=2 Tax=Dyadobacter sandarakinus TaxID=2747268 RepID=A0ABX7IDC7_9BACT|nr:molybdopterin-dependent oxidoreductase [Dyadobacter sandarakinus]
MLGILLLLSGAFSSFGQSTATLSIEGEITNPLELKLTDLARFKQVTHQIRDRDGKEHAFKGVALIDLLERAGVTTGSKLRGKNLAKYVLITAADGYEVIFALPEIDPEFTDQVILLATEKDGQLLPAGEGPFRIITPNDKKPARWIREVRTIRVGFAKE